MSDAISANGEWIYDSKNAITNPKTILKKSEQNKRTSIGEWKTGSSEI